MKRFLLVLAVICFHQVQAQNLVMNSGFEIYSSLPTAYGQLSNAVGWNNCNGTGTPDYFDTLSFINTYFGTNYPHSGHAMAGFCPWHGGISNYREYVSSQLISPMVSGQTYTFSFWLCNGINGGYGYGSNNIGVAFSTTPLIQTASGPI